MRRSVSTLGAAKELAAAIEKVLSSAELQSEMR